MSDPGENHVSVGTAAQIRGTLCWRMWIDLDRAHVCADCPSCGYGVEVQVLDVRTQVWRWCPCCRVQVRLVEPDGSVSAGIDAAHEAAKELGKTIEEFFQ